jgi:hypothetical protein
MSEAYALVPSFASDEESGGELALAAVSGTPGYETGGLIFTYYLHLREPGG